MASTAQMVAFAGTVMLGAMSPGPDFAVVVRHSAVEGRRGGMAAAVGIGAGVFVWAGLAALGVAALLAASAMAFTVVKLVGACYLFYLGMRSLRSAAKGGAGHEADADEGAAGSRWAAFRRGLLCNVLNPKAAVFFVALMPQFLGEHPAVTDTLAMSLIATVITAVWFSVVATVVGALRRVFSRARVRRAIDAVTGTALIGLGVRLAATRT
jgi:RhtB (resistance to homoserine/threonine) family protein